MSQRLRVLYWTPRLTEWVHETVQMWAFAAPEESSFFRKMLKMLCSVGGLKHSQI